MQPDHARELMKLVHQSTSQGWLESLENVFWGGAGGTEEQMMKGLCSLTGFLWVSVSVPFVLSWKSDLTECHWGKRDSSSPEPPCFSSWTSPSSLAKVKCSVPHYPLLHWIKRAQSQSYGSFSKEPLFYSGFTYCVAHLHSFYPLFFSNCCTRLGFLFLLPRNALILLDFPRMPWRP